MRTHLGLMLVVTLSACNHAPSNASRATESSPLRTAQASAMDSATIARLCLRPDSVRTGRAPCVLKDQSRSPSLRQPDPPASPPR